MNEAIISHATNKKIEIKVKNSPLALTKKIQEKEK